MDTTARKPSLKAGTSEDSNQIYCEQICKWIIVMEIYPESLETP
jgi:hypothetical protein